MNAKQYIEKLDKMTLAQLKEEAIKKGVALEHRGKAKDRKSLWLNLVRLAQEN